MIKITGDSHGDLIKFEEDNMPGEKTESINTVVGQVTSSPPLKMSLLSCLEFLRVLLVCFLAKETF